MVLDCKINFDRRPRAGTARGPLKKYPFQETDLTRQDKTTDGERQPIDWLASGCGFACEAREKRAIQKRFDEQAAAAAENEDNRRSKTYKKIIAEYKQAIQLISSFGISSWRKQIVPAKYEFFVGPKTSFQNDYVQTFTLSQFGI